MKEDEKRWMRGRKKEEKRREKWKERIKLGNKDQRKKMNDRKKYENKESKNEGWREVQKVEWD